MANQESAAAAREAEQLKQKLALLQSELDEARSPLWMFGGTQPGVVQTPDAVLIGLRMVVATTDKS